MNRKPLLKWDDRRRTIDNSNLIAHRLSSLLRRPVAHPRRLRPKDRALAEALDQLRAGVPLNWAQMEDNPEMAALEGLQDVAQECREQETSYVPAALRVEIFGRLSAQLPEKQPEPAKPQPKPLAGFSESVHVLTQTEEEIPALTFNMARVGRVVAGVAVLSAAIWAVLLFAGASKPPSRFTWIEVRQGQEVVSQRRLPAGWSAPRCRDEASRRFISIPDRNQLQLYAGFTVEFLPQKPAMPTTYTLRLVDMAVSPCLDTVPDPSDPGTVVKLSYSSQRQQDRSFDISPLVVFQAKEQATSIDASGGAWKEVHIGDAQGVYWQGGPYRDIEGTDWIGDVNVLALEREDYVITLIGRPEHGVTEEMLIELASQLR